MTKQIPSQTLTLQQNSTFTPDGEQAGISCSPVIVNEALDTIHLTLKLDIPQEFLQSLKEKKEALQSGDRLADCVQFGETMLFAWNLQRTGKKLYPYILKTGDVTLCLSNRDSDSHISNAMLLIGSLSSQDSPSNLFKIFRKWCKLHGIKVKQNQVSRVDVCADLALNITKTAIWNQAKHITRAEKFACYYSNRTLTGVQVGTGDIVFRAYDKLQEMLDKQALHKLEFFTKVWGGEQSSVTRVEFQLRREAIKQFCPVHSNLGKVIANIPNIWKYLTTQWFRQTAKAVDRLNRNQGRSTVSEFWKIVQSCHRAPISKSAQRTKKQRNINITSLVQQAAGIMTTVCAALGHTADDFFGILATSARVIQDKLADNLSSSDFAPDFRSRVVGATVSF